MEGAFRHVFLGILPGGQNGRFPLCVLLLLSTVVVAALIYFCSGPAAASCISEINYGLRDEQWEPAGTGQI